MTTNPSTQKLDKELLRKIYCENGLKKKWKVEIDQRKYKSFIFFNSQVFI